MFYICKVQSCLYRIAILQIPNSIQKEVNIDLSQIKKGIYILEVSDELGDCYLTTLCVE